MIESKDSELKKQMEILVDESRQVSSVAQSILPILQSLDKKIEDYRIKVTALQEEADEKKESIRELNAKVKNLERGRDNAVTELKKQEETFLNNTAELENQIRAAKARTTNLQDRFQSLQRELDELRNGCRETEKENRELRNKVIELEKEQKEILKRHAPS